MSGLRISIAGLPEAEKAVAQMTTGIRPKLQKVTLAGARAFKPAAQAEARPLSRRMARGVTVKRGKRERPSAVLRFSPWFAHFVLGGTVDHGPKTRRVLRFQSKGNTVFAHRVRGVPPHPILERVFAEKEQAASNAMADELLKE